jgi:uncharacterized membrane protein
MFEFLFKYPSPVFTKGRFVLLSAWPVWLLVVLIALFAALLALLTYRKISTAAPRLRKWRIWMLWGIQSAFITLVLLLLWQPAMRVSALTSQQNIIAVVVDTSRSMSIPDSDGKTRESAALNILENGLIRDIQKRFQVRLYRLGSNITRVDGLQKLQPEDPATNINAGLRKLAEDTRDLPIGAVLLLSDGAQNSAEIGESGVALETLQSLRNRRLPVHTIGFGRPEIERDLELENISVAPSSVINSRLSAALSFVQHGFAGQTARISVRDGDKILSSREVKLAPNGVLQTEPLFFSAGTAGARDLQFAIEPLTGEENLKNNAMTRSILVNDSKRRVLYVEGEPRWEYKFIRRAEEEDPTIQLVSMLRTSENKIYRQGINDPMELAAGFPTRPEDLFGYAGIIIGSVDADYFSPLQRELLREYVDHRGGGVLFLGGRMSLSEGGWGASSVSELLPTFLPNGRNSFHRNAATVELTAAGADSSITRLLDDPAKNVERWKKFTYLADYQDAGSPKPGALVLAQMSAGRRRLPLLITQSYGHGRTAILATGGTWRWQMSEALGDPSHNLFWQQLIRWLVADSPGRISASASSHLLMDDGNIQLRAFVRDPQFQPAMNARVSAHILGPQGVNSFIDLHPSQETPGEFVATWDANKSGAYLAEITTTDDASIQKSTADAVTFRREDGIAEDFHTEQNRQLLEQLSEDTGGRYWKPDEFKDLPQNISYSEAGISVRTTNPLWNMPVVFLSLLGLRSSEWLLRRKWGIV